MALLAQHKSLNKAPPQTAKAQAPAKKAMSAGLAKVAAGYRKAEAEASAKIPTLKAVSKSGSSFARKHPKTAKTIYTAFEKAHASTQKHGTPSQRQALAGYTYGSYQALQRKPIKTSAMFGAGLVGGRAISAVGKVGRAFGAGTKAARMAKAAELGIVGVYGYQTTKNIMDAPTPYEAGQRAALAMYTEILPMSFGGALGARSVKVSNNIKTSSTKKIKAPKPVRKAKRVAKEKATATKTKVKGKVTKQKTAARYKVSKAARPVARPVKAKKVAVKQTLTTKKRIAKVKTIKSKAAARKQITAIEKKIVGLNRELKKFKDSEKAEVELVRVKETQIERIKSPSEIQSEIAKTKANIRSLEKTFERTKDLAVKGRIKIAQRQLKQLEGEKIKREVVFEDLGKLKQKVRAERQKIKATEKEIEVEKVILKATKERLKLLLVSVETVKEVEREVEKEIESEKVIEKELEKVKEIEREMVRVSEREVIKVKEVEREVEKEVQKQRVKTKVKTLPLVPIPVIPQKGKNKKKKQNVRRVKRLTGLSETQVKNSVATISSIFGGSK